MTSRPRVLFLSTTAMPRIAGTDAVFQDIDALRTHMQGDMLSLYPFRFATRFYPPFLLGWHAVRRLRRLAATADVLHVFAPGVWRIPVLSGLNKPVIVTITAEVAGQRRMFSPQAATRAHAIVVSTPGDVTWLTEQGLQKVTHIPPGIDLPDGNTSVDRRPAAFTLLVGSAPWNRDQFKSKGIDVLLDVIDSRPGIRLLFLWRGFERQTLERHVRRRGLVDRVEVIDKHADIYALLSRSHAAIVLAEHPRVIKPYPHSLLESLAADRPVVTSGCIGLAADVRRTGSGVVVDTLSHKDVVAALDALQANYESFASAAQQFNVLQYARQCMVDRYMALYEQTGTRPGPRLMQPDRVTHGLDQEEAT